MNWIKSLRLPRYWPLALVASSAAGAIWSGWVGLGGLCGFGPVRLLPGIAPGFVINTAITLPVGVEAYGAYAMWAWLAHKGSRRTQEWARNSALAALALGCLGQIAYHLMDAARWDAAPWPVTMAVSCMPVVTFGFAAALTHMLIADTKTEKKGKPSRKPARKPAAQPEMPDLHAVPDAADNPHEAARTAYRESVRNGRPLSQRALGGMFGFSRQWGTDRIKEVEAEATA